MLLCANLSNRCIDRMQSTCRGSMPDSESEEECPVLINAFQVRFPAGHLHLGTPFAPSRVLVCLLFICNRNYAQQTGTLHFSGPNDAEMIESPVLRHACLYAIDCIPCIPYQAPTRTRVLTVPHLFKFFSCFS